MIKVPFELLEQIVEEQIDLFIDGVHYWYETYEEEVRGYTTNHTAIFERENYPTKTNPDRLCGHFAIDIPIIQLGYKNYEIMEEIASCELYEVKKREEIIVTYTRK